MATKTTPTSPRAWRPDVTAFVPSDVIPNAVILQAATMVGQIEGDEPAVRVPYVADDGVVGFVPEATEIPDANQQFFEVVVTTGKIAALGKYSYETLQQPNAAHLVVDSLNRSVTAKANAASLGNATDPLGSFNTVGITNGGTVGANLDNAHVDPAGGEYGQSSPPTALHPQHCMS